MTREYHPNNLYQKYITTITMPDFDFILHYAEKLNESTIEFLHYHPLYEIYYVIEGELCIFVHDGKIHLKAGEVLYIAPGINHHVYYEPDLKRDYFVMIFDFVSKNTVKSPSSELEYREIKRELELIRQENYIHVSEEFEGKKILENIWTEMKEQKTGWNSVSNGMFFHFFILALRHINKKRSIQKAPDGILNMGIEASKYIHMNYMNEITIESAAQFLNITPRHVNRVFQSLFGTTFTKTLMTLRMEYAKNYLCNTDYAIERIANQVGFASAKTLQKLFQEMEEMTVSQYRSQYKVSNSVNEQLFSK